MNLEPNIVYMLGIGGIGMSAIARYFNHKGATVYGYDKTATVLTDKLIAEGIHIHFDEDITQIPEHIDLLIYTPAIPTTNKEFEYFQESELVLHKRSEILGAISKKGFTIAVAGSHGKTTITSMISHLLHHSGYGCTAFIGGICVNYDTNFLTNGSDTYIIEADEYDRSFHRLYPDIAIVTATDDDHLEIYGDHAHVVEAYEIFVSQIKEKGTLIYKKHIGISEGAMPSLAFSYHLDDKEAVFNVASLKTDNGCYSFQLTMENFTQGGTTETLSLSLNIGGLHNVENSIPAIVVAKLLGIDNKKIQEALASFKGIKRRFEYILQTKNKTFIDDYAHHPKELEALLSSTRKLFVNKKVLIIFQPHLYSRTQHLAKQFAEALQQADEAMLMEIYPAREKPIDGVSSNLIIEYLNNADKNVYNKNNVLKAVTQKYFDVIITAGAGNISDIVIPLKKQILNELPKG